MSVLEAQHELYQRSIKRRPGTELLCEYVFRPAAQLVVLALRPLGVAPPAVVLANAAAGLLAARKTDDPQAAVRQAAQAIDSGQVIDLVSRLAELTQKFVS